MFSKLHLLRAALVMATLALFFGSSSSATAGRLTRATASNSTTFSDATGDGGTAADIVTVTVSSDPTGQITFQVSFAAPLETTDSVGVFLDTDQNPATGDPNAAGADYLFGASESDNRFGLERWDGSSWQDAPAHATPSVTGGKGTNYLTYSINKSELGDPGGFNVWLDSMDGDGGPGHEDQAPDTGAWNVQLQTATAPLKLSIVGFKLDNVHGDVTAVLLVQRSDTAGFLGAEGAIRCRASVAGRSRARSDAAFVTISQNGVRIPVAACVWSIPPKLRGKTINGTMTVSYQGVAVKRSFSALIR